WASSCPPRARSSPRRWSRNRLIRMTPDADSFRRGRLAPEPGHLRTSLGASVRGVSTFYSRRKVTSEPGANEGQEGAKPQAAKLFRSATVKRGRSAQRLLVE